MIYNKDTSLYFSVSSNPSNFGTTVYNFLFNHYEINAFYKALSCGQYEFPEILRSLRIIKAKGLSVSMPFKKLARQLVDPGDNATSLINNANSIDLIKNKCYNTDLWGFAECCIKRNWNPKATGNILIIGNGAMSTSIQSSLNVLGHKFLVVKKPDSKDYSEFNWLINTTPVGMQGIKDDLYDEDFVSNFEFVTDVVINKNTNLEKLAKKTNAFFMSGIEICKNQLIKQFEIYTGFKPEEEIVNAAVKYYEDKFDRS